MSFIRIGAAAALLGLALGAPNGVAQPAAAPATPKPTPAPTAIAVPAGPVGKVEIKETLFDAGKVERGTDVSHVFSVKNIGQADLTVDAKPG